MHIKRYVKVGLGNKTSSSGRVDLVHLAGAKCALCRAPVLRCTAMRLTLRSTIVLSCIAQCASSCTQLHCAMRLKWRAPQLRPCSPLLPIFRSLSSTGDHLPLCQRLHTCVPANVPKPKPSEDIHWSPSWSSSISPTIQRPGAGCNHPSGSRPPQPSWPGALAGWQTRQGAQRMDAKNAVWAGPTNQSANQVAMPESWRGALANQPPGCRDLNTESSMQRAQRRRGQNKKYLNTFTALPTDQLFFHQIPDTSHMNNILGASFLAANCKFDWFLLTRSV